MVSEGIPVGQLGANMPLVTNSDKMAAILQTMSNVVLQAKYCLFGLRFYMSFIPGSPIYDNP